ncbi:putative monooxygenase [Corynespora cassiicola Philippines]|uniref:Putative monooxygenase n=1 Tax=Corynespora cassiicola Philippines TaxID=1448308 RepID=A0A2T2PD34_CORCC|nr:putative monooxygenase [Corynespora cassiicola Philippines]
MALPDATDLEARYAQERDKRLRPDGMQQYSRLPSEQETPLAHDPWLGLGGQQGQQEGPLQDGAEVQFLIIGAGLVGLLAGGRLVEAGFSAQGMCLVDVAGGFGGTWYWNRYPGLQCDVESYIYLPFLEETGYVPSQKYASGEEIRQHCERVAGHFGLRGQFSTRVLSATWDEGRRRWVVRMRREGGGKGADGKQGEEFTVLSQFVIPASTIFTAPRMPKLDGFDELQANVPVFHTARWDFDCTGGSPTDPTLSKLKGKRVGVMGTGATAVQVVPAVARYAGHLHVFQRTPSYCGPRRQKATDKAAWARDVATGPGWQKARRLNFDTFFDGEERGPDHPDLVADGWTQTARGFAGFIGGPRLVTPETAADHANALRELDVPLAEQARARVRDLVADPATAERLEPWYPMWCKRPAFQDEYLPAFNQPNVSLVDTDGKGVERCTARGIVVNGVEYELDVLILATGFLLATGADAAPAELFGIPVTGRNGRRLKDKYGSPDFGTIHGIATNGFPNLLYPGLGGGAGSPNLTAVFDLEATHLANVLKEAARRVDDPSKLVVEPTKQGEDAWTDEIEKWALWYSVVLACTPGYFNHEGATMRLGAAGPEHRRLAMRRVLHGGGMAMYERIVREYDAKGDIEGFEVS